MTQNLIIGKYTLESLTNGLYSSPLDLYREYIQNSVDSFDTAIECNLERKEALCININIDDDKNVVSIFDNGCGIPKAKAVSTLIDIGNSNKIRNSNRGFRGIGRLAGLGYCNELIFTTSAAGESVKTIVRFNAKLLKDLLISSNHQNASIEDVLSQVISTEIKSEKAPLHYFNVFMRDVTKADGLMDVESVKNYLIQHAPLPFDKGFKWRNTIQEKVRLAGYNIPNYHIFLNREELTKPYGDTFVADRVKKVTDNIQDIRIQPFYNNKNLSAVLWYAHTSFFGTINDNAIKGMRIRQGNLLIGNRTTCNEFFKEERFNGWILGELHVVDPNLIVNSRRDDFEKNEAYYSLVDNFKAWATTISKSIRQISCERSLSREKIAVVEAQSYEDINDLCSEDLSYAEDTTESDFLDQDESSDVAAADYIGKLGFLIDQKRSQTKYTALNINHKLTTEQRKTLERVFDLIQDEYTNDISNQFINTIAKLF